MDDRKEGPGDTNDSPRSRRIRAAVRASSNEPTRWPQAFVEVCARELPVSGVGLALMTEDGHAGTVATSDDRAALLEDLQFSLGEGPCVDSSSAGRPVLQPDLSRTGPALWPGFTEAAVKAGIHAVFALPMQVGAIRVGVLDLYRVASGELWPHDLADALTAAESATSLVLDLQAQAHLESHLPDEEGVAVPLRVNRAEVHQATGMVAARAGVPLAEALALIRARAFSAGLPILAVARAVLAGELRLSATDDGWG